MDIQPDLIIDGGANIGLASILFANKFPYSNIIAVEPEKSNIELLILNTKIYDNIKIIKSALWNCNTPMKIKDLNYGKWGFLVENAIKDDTDFFTSITIDDIVRNCGNKNIDILKLDIEGAEKELFTDNYKHWLEKVNILIIELHEHLKPGCEATFSSAISGIDFDRFQKGENIVLIKK